MKKVRYNNSIILNASDEGNCVGV